MVVLVKTPKLKQDNETTLFFQQEVVQPNMHLLQKNCLELLGKTKLHWRGSAEVSNARAMQREAAYDLACGN
eukprot:2805527-Amphidinium_carterae.2